MHNWFNLTKFLPYLKRIAHARDSQKLKYKSTKNWSVESSTHFIGICSEFGFYLETGIRPDFSLKVEGDQGWDFVIDNKTFDVKGSTFWGSPDLKEFSNREKYADIYVLAAVRDYKEVAIAGWCTREQLKTNPGRSYGHGMMHSVPYWRMEEWGQTGLPPFVQRRSESKLSQLMAELRV